MKKLLIYGLGLALALTSCTKKNDEATGPVGLTGIEAEFNRVEFVYDEFQRIIKCNYRSRGQNGWLKIYHKAILHYEENLVTSIELQNTDPDEFRTVAVVTFTYNANRQITQRKLKSVGSASEVIATFGYDNQNRLITSNQFRFETYEPVRPLQYNEQGNLVKDNYDYGSPTRHIGTYEYNYDTKKNILAENSLGQFLFVTGLIPEQLKANKELLFSKNNPVKINEKRASDHYLNSTPFQVSWVQITNYSNEYNEDGYLRSFVFAQTDINGQPVEKYNPSDEGSFIFGKKTIESNP